QSNDLLTEIETLRNELEVERQDNLKLKAQCTFLSNELAFVQAESTAKLYPSASTTPDLDISDTESVASSTTMAYTASLADSDFSNPKSSRLPRAASVPSRQQSSSSIASSTRTAVASTNGGSRRSSSRQGSTPLSPPFSAATTASMKRRTSTSPAPPASSTLAATQTARIKKLALDLRQMTHLAQDYLTQVETLGAQVETLERKVGQKGVEVEQHEMLRKVGEESAMHRVNVLTSKLDKVEKAYEGAEEYINGLEEELRKREKNGEQVETLETFLQASRVAQEGQVARIAFLEAELAKQSTDKSLSPKRSQSVRFGTAVSEASTQCDEDFRAPVMELQTLLNDVYAEKDQHARDLTLAHGTIAALKKEVEEARDAMEEERTENARSAPPPPRTRGLVGTAPLARGLVAETRDVEVQSEMDSMQFSRMASLVKTSGKELKAAQDTTTALESRNKQLQNDLDYALSKLTDLEDKERVHRRSLSLATPITTQSRAPTSTHDATLLLQSENTALKTRLADLQGLESKLYDTASRYHTHAEIQDLEREVVSARDTIQNLTSRLNMSEARAVAAEEMYASMQVTVGEVEARLVAVYAHEEVLCDKLVAATLASEEERRVAGERVGQMKGYLESTRESMDKVLEEVAVCGDEYVRCKAELEKVKTDLVVARKEHGETKERAVQLERDVNFAKALHENEVESHKDTLARAVREVAMKADDHATRAVSLEKELHGVRSIAKSDTDAKDKALAALRDRVVELEREVNYAKAAHENEVVAHKDTLARAVKEVEMKAKDHATRAVSLEKELHGVRSIAKSETDAKDKALAANLRAAEEALAAERARGATLNGTLSVITAQFTASSNECEELKAELEATMSELNEVEDLLHAETEAHSQTKNLHQIELNSAHERAQVEVSCLQRELENVRGAIQKESLAERVKELEARLVAVQNHEDVLCTRLGQEHEGTLALLAAAERQVEVLEARVEGMSGVRELHSASVSRVKCLETELSEALAALNRDHQNTLELHAAAVARAKLSNQEHEVTLGLLNDSSEKIGNLQAHLEEIKNNHSDEVVALNNKHQATRDLHAASVAREKELEEQIRAAQNKHAIVVSNLNSEHQRTRDLHAALLIRVSDLETELENARNQHASTVSSLNRDLQNTRDLHASAVARVRDLESELAKATHHHTTLVSELNNGHQATRDLHVATLARVKTLESELGDARNDHAQALVRLESTRDLHHQTVSGTVQDLEQRLAQVHQHADVLCGKLAGELERAVNTHDSLLQQIALLEHQLSQAKAEHKDVVGSLTRDLNATRDLHVSAADRAKALELEYMNARNDHAKEVATLHETHNARAAELEGKRQTARDLHVGSRGEVEELKSRLGRLQAEHDATVASLKQVLERDADGRVEGLEVRLREVELQHHRLMENVLRDQDAVVTGLDDRVRGLETANRGLETANRGLETANRGLANQLGEVAELKALYERRIAELEAAQGKLVAEHASRLAAADQLRSTLSSSNSELTRQLKEVCEVKAALEARLAKLEAELAGAHRKVADKEVHIARSIGSSNENLDALKSQHASVVSRLNLEHQSTKDLHSAACDRIKALESSLEDAQRQHKSLRSNVTATREIQSASNEKALDLERRLFQVEQHRDILISKLELDFEATLALYRDSADKVKELEARLERLQHQNASLVSGVDSDHRAAIAGFVARISESEKTYTALVLANETLLKQCDLLMGIKARHEKRIGELEADLAELRPSLLNKDRELKEALQSHQTARELHSVASIKAVNLESSLADTNRKNRDLHAAAANRVKELSDQHDVVVSKLERSRTLHAGAQSEVEDLKARLESVEQHRDVLCGKLVEDHLAVVALLNAQISTSVYELESTKSVLENKSKALDAAERGLACMKEILSKQIDPAEHNQKVSRLQSRINVLEGQLNSSQATVAELNEKYRSGERDAESLRTLWMKLDVEEREGRKKQLEIIRLEERVNDLLAQLADGRDTNSRIAELETQVTTITKRYETESSLHKKAVADLHQLRDAANAKPVVTADRQIELRSIPAPAVAPSSKDREIEVKSIPAFQQAPAPVVASKDIPMEFHNIGSRAVTKTVTTKTTSIVPPQECNHGDTIDNLTRDLELARSQADDIADTHLAATLRHANEIEQHKSTIESLRHDLSEAAQNYSIMQSELTDVRLLHENALQELGAEKEKCLTLQTKIDGLLANPGVNTHTTTSREIHHFTTSDTASADSQDEEGTVRNVRVFAPHESTLLGAFRNVSDDQWALLSQELIEKDERIRDLEEKLELVSAIPDILKKWEETFVEQEAELEQLEKELADAHDELNRVRGGGQSLSKEVIVTTTSSTPPALDRGINVSERTHTRTDASEHTHTHTDASEHIHTHTETVLLHPEFEAISAELEEKNALIVDLQFRLEKLSAIPEILKTWEDAFKAQENDIDQLEAELDAAHTVIRKLQSVTTTNNTTTVITKSVSLGDSDGAIDVPPLRSISQSTDSSFSSNTILPSPGSSPGQSESFVIAFNQDTGEYYLPDGAAPGTTTVGAHDYIDVLRQHISQLERAFGESRSRIMNLQSQVSHLELANSDASLRVSRARADLIEVSTSKRLLEARLDRIKEHTICGLFKNV
ncbi:hypothetical protein HDU98_007860, partial [Podochytrium sp. JEL0797]